MPQLPQAIGRVGAGPVPGADGSSQPGSDARLGRPPEVTPVGDGMGRPGADGEVTTRPKALASSFVMTFRRTESFGGVSE